MEPEFDFFAFYFCESVEDDNRLSGLQLLLESPTEGVEPLKLNALGPMNGECFGRQVKSEGSQMNSLTAAYAPIGITALSFEVDGNFGAIGNASIGSSSGGSYPVLTRWNFD